MKNDTLYKLALEYAELMDIHEESISDLEKSLITKNEERINKYRLFKRSIEARINQTITIAEILGFDYPTLNLAANRIIDSEREGA